MAFNWNTFKTRTLTAIIFAAVMLTGLLWNHWSFLVLFSIIHFGCWWEYLKLTEKMSSAEIDPVIKYFFLISGFMLMLVVGIHYFSFDFNITIVSFSISIKWLVWIGSFILILVFLFQNKVLSNKVKWMCLLGLPYISLSWGFMLDLTNGIAYEIRDKSQFEIFIQNSFQVFIPVMIIASIWVNDTMAYIVGSLVGKTPLSKISPKKTWEGTIGGAVLAIIFIALGGHYFFNISLMNAIAIATLSATFGTLGDLLESKLKRMADVKDSGNFMPGHGGFLDRFDSLLLATPAVWVFVQLFT